MTDDELKAALDSARTRMMNDEDGSLSDIRKDNLGRYMGDPDGRERPGYSSYVTREVFEAIEWALPSLLRIFTGGDRMVAFQPVGPEDEKQAEQETDIVNHYLMQDANGFMALYEWFKDALLYPNGYAKVYTEEVTKTRSERYSGLTEWQLQQVMEQEGVDVIEATGTETLIQTPQGAMPATVYDVKLKITEKCKKLRFDAVPPEQIGIDGECTSVDVDEARYVVHKSQRTKSWLIEAGYDRELLDTAPAEKDDEWEDETNSRHSQTFAYLGDDDSLDETTAIYTLEEWYILVDYDGDGIAERRKVDVIGGEIFTNEEYDYQPIVALSCIPVPHRHDGMALATIVKPIQELSTFYQRSINDNIARINRPRKYVNENTITDDGQTIEQLQDINSDFVIMRDVAGIMPEQHQPVIQELLMAHQAVKDQVQNRTGVSPGIALDADVLKKSTEGAYSQALNAASQLMEMIARIFAETGVKKAMLKAHRQIKEHQDVGKVMKLRGEWIETNPADWKDRENVVVNVALGFSDKAQQLQASQAMIGMQAQLLPLGMVDPQLVMNALEDFVEALGKKGVERYFKLPPPPNPQEQQPDPLVMAQIQAILGDLQRKTAETQAKITNDNALMDAKLEGENAKTQKALADALKAYIEAGASQQAAMTGQLATSYGSD